MAASLPPQKLIQNRHTRIRRALHPTQGGQSPSCKPEAAASHSVRSLRSALCRGPCQPAASTRWSTSPPQAQRASSENPICFLPALVIALRVLLQRCGSLIQFWSLVSSDITSFLGNQSSPFLWESTPCFQVGVGENSPCLRKGARQNSFSRQKCAG